MYTQQISKKIYQFRAVEVGNSRGGGPRRPLSLLLEGSRKCKAMQSNWDWKLWDCFEDGDPTAGPLVPMFDCLHCKKHFVMGTSNLCYDLSSQRWAHAKRIPPTELHMAVKSPFAFIPTAPSALTSPSTPQPPAHGLVTLLGSFLLATIYQSIGLCYPKPFPQKLLSIPSLCYANPAGCSIPLRPFLSHLRWSPWAPELLSSSVVLLICIAHILNSLRVQ